MKSKLLLLCLLLCVLSLPCLSLEYRITSEQLEEMKQLYKEQKQLTNTILVLSKDKQRLLQNLKDIEIERKIDSIEKKKLQEEKENLRKEKNKLIVEKENELIVVGKSIASLEAEKAVLKKLLKLSKKQLEEERKSSKKSWPGIIDYLIWGGCFFLGIILGGINR